MEKEKRCKEIRKTRKNGKRGQKKVETKMKKERERKIN
jgi:hypothetical protein